MLKGLASSSPSHSDVEYGESVPCSAPARIVRGEPSSGDNQRRRLVVREGPKAALAWLWKEIRTITIIGNSVAIG